MQSKAIAMLDQCGDPARSLRERAQHGLAGRLQRSPDTPVSSTPGPDPTGPIKDGAQRVKPHPGTDNPRPSAFTKVKNLDEQTLRVFFYQGVAPCSVLDRVEVEYGTKTIGDHSVRRDRNRRRKTLPASRSRSTTTWTWSSTNRSTVGRSSTALPSSRVRRLVGRLAEALFELRVPLEVAILQSLLHLPVDSRRLIQQPSSALAPSCSVAPALQVPRARSGSSGSSGSLGFFGDGAAEEIAISSSIASSSVSANITSSP